LKKLLLVRSNQFFYKKIILTKGVGCPAPFFVLKGWWLFEWVRKAVQRLISKSRFLSRS
jgi:hypothetical protein